MIIGIDPGKNGGMAALRDDGQIMRISAYESDTDFIGKIYAWNRLLPATKTRCIVERVHSMPGQGVASTFSFGRSVGFIHGVLTAHELPWEEIIPQEWQKILKIPKRDKSESKTAFKRRLLDTAKKMYPNEPTLNLKTCDAVLIAEAYRRKMFCGKL